MSYNLVDFQIWLDEVYKREKWNEYHTFTDSNFLLEEQGEIAELIIDLTKDSDLIYKNDFRDKIIEEIGDMVSAIVAICNRFNITVYDRPLDDKRIYDYHDSFYVTQNTHELLLVLAQLSKEVGMLARNIRRCEIGRHAHNENLSVEYTKSLLSNSLNVVLSHLYNVSDFLNCDFNYILSYHQSKMNKKYPSKSSN